MKANQNSRTPNPGDTSLSYLDLVSSRIQEASPLQAVDEHQAAAIMKKSVHSLRNERFLGKGCPYVKDGRSVRYLLGDISTHLHKNRIVPANR